MDIEETTEENQDQPTEGVEEDPTTPEEGTEPEGVQPEGDTPTEEPEGNGSEPSTIEIDGQQFTPDQVKEAIKAAQDYKHLVPQFTQVTQELAELRKGQQGGDEPVKEQVEDPETLEYLKKLGIVTMDDLQAHFQKQEAERQQAQEDARLAQHLEGLEKQYDGSNGLPKFSTEEVLQFCVENGIGNPEYGYQLMHLDAIKEHAARGAQPKNQAPPSSAGEGTSKEPAPKKRVFGAPEGDEQINLRDSIMETIDSMAGSNA